MLEFRKIEREDMSRIKAILAMSDYRGCEYSFANNLAWHRLYKTYICIYKDFYISMSEADGIYFTFPAGKGDYRELFGELKKYSESRGYPLTVGSVDEERYRLLSELFPDSFTLEKTPDSYDYIYNSADLRELPGKKYHKKRNHLKKIEKYNYTYSALTEADFDDCIEFAAVHYNGRDGHEDESSVGEQLAIHTFFDNFDYLGLSGGVLRVDGRVAAFTVGERLNSDTLDVHIEKADTSIDGAYPAINNFYARQAAEKLMYINREEDMGIEGLRKSKLSYYPAFMQIKDTVIFK